MSEHTDSSVVIMGGGGHVGIPLGIALASKGIDVTLFDINEETVDTINSGELPILEAGAAPLLRTALAEGLLRATTDPASMPTCLSPFFIPWSPEDPKELAWDLRSRKILPTNTAD